MRILNAGKAANWAQSMGPLEREPEIRMWVETVYLGRDYRKKRKKEAKQEMSN